MLFRGETNHSERAAGKPGAALRENTDAEPVQPFGPRYAAEEDTASDSS
jgi:hypothetical protein